MGVNRSTFLEKEGGLPEDKIKDIAKNPVRFWPILMQLPLKTKKITAWNFCYILHRILCNASPTDICQLGFKKDMIQEMGTIWVLYTSNKYGRLIYLYTVLLQIKLKFLENYPKISGKFVISREELKKLVETRAEFMAIINDIFEFRELNLELQDEILKSIEKKDKPERVESKTMPIRTIFQDYICSNRLLKHLDETWDKTPIPNFYDRANVQTQHYTENLKAAQQYNL